MTLDWDTETYEFYYVGAAPGDVVYLLVNPWPTTGGECMDYNGRGCIGGASIWDAMTVEFLDAGGATAFYEASSWWPSNGAWFGSGANALYAAIYDETTGVLSNWANMNF